jgi:hypothetical protein
MMLLEGLFPHGVMMGITISMALCGVTFPVVALELWGVILVANANLGPRYAIQVGLVAALNTNLDDTIMELQELRDQQEEDRREIKRLKAVIAGRDEEEVREDEERWLAMSPRPRRTSHGSLRSRTRIIWP